MVNMGFPSPSEKQAKVLWFSLTALAIAIFLALLTLMFYGVAWLLDRLTPVLLPLAVAGIFAFLLNPLVDYFEKRMSPDVGLLFKRLTNPKRVKAIILVFLLGVGLITSFTVLTVVTVVPELVKLGEETSIEEVEGNIISWMDNQRDSDFGSVLQLGQLHDRIEKNGGLGLSEMFSGSGDTSSKMDMAEAITMIGLLAGMALVPVYVFYFLLEAQTIQRKWSDYLPLKESKFKEEAVFMLQAFNECLIVFFRGQVLVAMCVGLCLAIGFSLIGLPFGILLGLVAGMVGIIPYFGVIVSTVPVLLLSLTRGNEMYFLGQENWALGGYAPVAAIAVCLLVLFLEKTVIQPRIIGDRVGMHPVAVIISVLIGTTLVGGVIGGLLAIPIAMALRTALFRYVWIRRQAPEKAVQLEVL